MFFILPCFIYSESCILILWNINIFIINFLLIHESIHNIGHERHINSIIIHLHNEYCYIQRKLKGLPHSCEWPMAAHTRACILTEN